MPNSEKFPTTPEIKRVLTAVKASGFESGLIEIEPTRIRIFTWSDTDHRTPGEKAYDAWKAQSALD